MPTKLIIFLLILSCQFASLTHAAEASAKQSINFLVLTDIHFDPFTYCKGSKPCPLIQKLKQAPSKEWSGILASLNAPPSIYKSDTNYTLMNSALIAAKQAAHDNNVHSVLILGDFLGHDFHRRYKRYARDNSMAGYQVFVKKTLEFINEQIAATFPNIDVFALVGNNDSYQGDYFVQPQGRFLQDMKTSWGDLIKTTNHKAQMQTTFNKAGYYAIEMPEQSLRILMLNTVLFSSHNKTNGGYAEQQLSWIEDQLKLARSKQQKVIIAMHIPMGIDVYATLRIRLFTLVQLWQTKYVTAFHDLLANYANDIAAVFAAHLHSDWFQILTFKNTKSEIPAIGTPAISPIFGNNPGFKIYTYSVTNRELDNFKTYYYPINQSGPWKIEYDFHSIYRSHCKYCHIPQVFHAIRANALLGSIYKNFYSVNTTSQPITQKWIPYYSCAMKEIFPAEYQACIG